MTDIKKIVLKYIEMVGPSEAARVMKISRQTINNHMKNPGNITVKEFEAAVNAMPALLTQALPPKQNPREQTAREAMETMAQEPVIDQESFGGTIPTEAQEPIDEALIPPMNFRPVEGQPAPTVLDQILGRLDRLEEFIRVLAGPYSPVQDRPDIMAQARKLLPELSGTMTGKKFRGVDHPLHQVQVQGGAPLRPRPRPVTNVAADLNWNSR